MWQRKQTIFLLLEIAALLTILFFPIWERITEGDNVSLFALYLKSDSTKEFMPYALVASLTIASITVAIIEIGKFKNRLLQIKLGALNSLLMAGVLISAIVFIRQLENTYGGGVYGFSAFLPAIAMICNSIANRLIRRDEKLVRESDRLR